MTNTETEPRFLDDNLAVTANGVECRHCGTVLGTTDDPVHNALVRVDPSVFASFTIREEPKNFTDREIVMRQSFCPGCLVRIAVEIVPLDEKPMRQRSKAF